MNIFLIGYMGSGKSTTGKILAKKLNMKFIDLDDIIERDEKKTIEDLFVKEGEIKFREIEHNYLKKTIKDKNIVLSLGGGTPCYYNNMELIKKNGISVYLKMSAGGLYNRLINSKKSRPLIKKMKNKDLKEFIESTLTDRKKYYEQADCIINAINLKIKQLINLVSQNQKKQTPNH